MKVSAEKLENKQVQLTIEIPEEEFENSLQKAYKIVVKKLNIPGFRKGKAPRKLIENIYGREILLEEALQDAIPKAYLESLEQLKDEYTPVSEPQYELVSTEKGEPVVFKAIFDNKPEIKLGEYKGLELAKVINEVTEEEIDNEIKKMQERFAKLLVVDGPTEKGDTVTIDFIGKVDNEAFQGGTAENYSLELGSNTFIPGFEDQLIGIKLGETVEVSVKFPEDYHSQELAGKDAVFTVTLKEIKRKELPELDDEFVKDVSEFSTMQELRRDVENKLKETAEKKANSELRAAAIAKATENAEVDIPESMIENRIQRIIADFEYRLKSQGISLDYYFQATGKTLEELKETYRPNAQESVKTDLVLEEIAKAEDLKAETVEVEKEIEKMAQQFNQEVAKVKAILEMQGQISSLEFGIMIDKAVDLIIREAKVSS